MSTNGKGSKSRPLSVSRKEYEEAWERTFGERITFEPAYGVDDKPPTAAEMDARHWNVGVFIREWPETKS